MDAQDTRPCPDCGAPAETSPAPSFTRVVTLYRCPKCGIVERDGLPPGTTRHADG